jgi:glycosyltransferase involved in cell wall biosynthesis
MSPERQHIDRTIEPEALFAVNGRFRTQRITGVQRYAHEIVSRLENKLDVIEPDSAKGAVGHLWEQTLLPWRCDGRLLWNPNCSGPLFYNRQVVTFHDLFPIDNPEWYSPAYARWYNIAMRRLAARAVHLIAVSEFTKDRIVKVLGRPPQDITVVSNGSHIVRRATADQTLQAGRALALPSRRYILSLSSLEKRKNVAALLQAWSELHTTLPDDVWLVLAGPKADTDIYGEQASTSSSLPRVFYTGYVPEIHLAGLYTGASLFVFPSLAEGFGLPLLEAMTCGVRCIASSTSSLPEVGGAAVTYIDPTDPAELARAIRACYRTGQQLEAFLPSQHQSKRFTWENAASKTLHVLESALETTVARSLENFHPETSVTR